jgi:hypothetical protein
MSRNVLYGRALKGASSSALFAALLLSACSQSLALKAELVQKVAAAATASQPALSLSQGTTTISAGGTFNLGSMTIGQFSDTVFTITDSGGATLSLSGNPGITGSNSGEFSIQALSGTNIAVGAAATFALRFSPVSAGTKVASVTIASNASAFSFSISANGVTAPSLTVTAGAGGTTSPSGASVVSSNVPFAISATPNAGGYIFVNWTVVSGSGVTFAVATSASTTATIASGSATIQANFAPPATRGWSAVASDASGQHLAAAVFGGQIFTSANYGAVWALSVAAPSASWSSIASDATGRYLAATVYAGSVYTSSDYGATWKAQSVGLPASPANFQTIASDASGKNLVLGVSGGTIYTSTDYGATWLARSSGLPATANWTSVASDGSGLYLEAAFSGTLGNIYFSVDGGATWAAQSVNDGVNPIFTGAWASVAINGSVQSANPFYVAAASGGDIWTRHDNGHVLWGNYVNPKYWTSIASDETGQYLAACASGPSGDLVYTSSNYGSTWTAGTGAPTATWSSVASDHTGTYLAAAVAGGHIYASTNQGGSWTLKL